MGHNKHHYTMKSFIHDAGKITKPIHNDVKSLVTGANKDFNKVVSTQASIANNVIKTSGSTLSSLSLPLMLVGGAVLIYMVTKK
jgi:hypothetical protein